MFTWILGKPKKAKREPCVIEFKGMFFDGKLWTEHKDRGKVFDSFDDAWDFIDTRLDPKGEYEEDFSLHRI